MTTIDKQTKKYLARYYYDGSWWGLEFQAYDFKDAEKRAKKLGLQLDGEHIMTIPAIVESTWFPNLIIWLRGLFVKD